MIASYIDATIPSKPTHVVIATAAVNVALSNNAAAVTQRALERWVDWSAPIVGGLGLIA